MGLLDKFQKAADRSVKVVAEQVEVKGKVLPARLNVRSKPSLKSRVIGQVRRGDIVNILNSLDEWYEILWGKNSKAYVYKKYVLIIAYIKRGRVTARRLNVRSQPSRSADIIGKLELNDQVFIVEEFLDWYAIDFHDRIAYVAKKYVIAHDLPPLGGVEAIKKYFHQRQDLINYPLAPKRKVPVREDNRSYRIAATSWNKYGGLMKKISLELGIEVEVAMAIICVESGGDGFDKNGRMIIRFENHLFDRFYGKFHPDTFKKYFRYTSFRDHKWYDPEQKQWIDVHQSQDTEWKVFNFAKKLDPDAAMKSISMGAPQIMGFNYRIIGYDSVKKMFENFQKDIRYQLFALFDFAKAKPDRLVYLQNKDFYSFAAEYNGPGQANYYKKHLLDFYHIFKKLL